MSMRNTQTGRDRDSGLFVVRLATEPGAPLRIVR